MNENNTSEQIEDNSKGFALIVDDVFENLQVLANILNSSGFRVAYATSGAKALKSIERKKPDIVLLDVNMPDMDGFETCQRIKQEPENEDIPVIFITARNLTEDIVRGFEAGSVDYVLKPFKPEELISRVNTHIELKKSKERIKLQNQKLNSLVATKDKFFSIIAHDLKNPFHGIQGLSELIVNNVKNGEYDKAVKYAEAINESSKGAFSLLENLLTWSRSQTGRIDFSIETLGAQSSIENAIAPSIAKSKLKNIEAIIEINEEFEFRADRNMFYTIIRNLTDNAVKFTPPRGRIIINAQKLDGEAYFSVSDSGIGMTQEDLNKLFRIEVKNKEIGSSKEKGTGLGLILCKEFVEKHDGKIWVDSKVNEGSKFQFTIPLNLV